MACNLFRFYSIKNHDSDIVRLVRNFILIILQHIEYQNNAYMIPFRRWALPNEFMIVLTIQIIASRRDGSFCVCMEIFQNALKREPSKWQQNRPTQLHKAGCDETEMSFRAQILSNIVCRFGESKYTKHTHWRSRFRVLEH